MLLHGFCESNEIFSRLAAALAQDYRVITPDLPGHGGQPWGRGFRNLDDAAFWLEELVCELELDQFVLCGHSLGGYIAAAYAQWYPARLRGLGLMHSTALADPAERRSNRDKALAFMEQHGTGAFLRSFVPSLFHQPEQAWLQTLNRIVRQTDSQAILALTAIMRDRPDRTSVLAGLDVPVLYVIGEHDDLVPPARSQQELTQVRLAAVHRIADAGHMAMYEAPDKLEAAVRSLMDMAGSN